MILFFDFGDSSSQDGVLRQMMLSAFIKLVQMVALMAGNMKRIGPKHGRDIYSLHNDFTSSLRAYISN